MISKYTKVISLYLFIHFFFFHIFGIEVFIIRIKFLFRFIYNRKMQKIKKILVTGDFIIDHHIFKGNRFEQTNSYKKNLSIIKKKGGAFLTYELIRQTTSSDDIEVTFDLDTTELTESESGFPSYQSYLNWDIVEYEKEDKTGKLILFEEYLGFGEKTQTAQRLDYKKLNITKGKNDIIIIDEANLGFRDVEDLWKIDRNSIVIYKTSYPIYTGKLFQTLVANAGENLFTVVTLENLRRIDIKVSQNISWEQTALDLVFEVTHNKQLKPLLQSANLIVTIGTAGAIHIIKGDSEKAEFHLIFDPENMEEEWENKGKNGDKTKYNGSAVGLGSSFLAGFVTGYYLSSKKYFNENPGNDSFLPVWSNFIITGLNFMRNTLSKGLISGFDSDNSFDYNVLTVQSMEKSLPHRFIRTFIPSPYWVTGSSYLKSNYWTILENNFDEKKPGFKKISGRQFYSLARNLAYRGVDSIKYAPIIKFGKLVTFDRNEIEGFRNIKKQILQFHNYDNGTRPLNIAVFGSPGSGKSFAVKELAKSIFESNKELINFQVYNLSQFKDAAELAGAFHTIRDAVLDGKLPFVFWDEFDTNNLQWLQYMLAPMQDGKFQDGKDTHPIGKAIFVFAGGTFYSMQHFKSQEKDKIFIRKKGPDFLSRINCYIDILGPNQRSLFNPETCQFDKDDELDICFPIRRALFLRSNLGYKEKDLLKMDWGLLSALLEVKHFKNGSRSLERLLNPLKNSRTGMIFRSDLPSDEIIEMNVDFASFIEMMYKHERDEEILFERIAEQIHTVWAMKNIKESIYNVVYKELPYDARLDNIAAAMRMKDIINSSAEFRLSQHLNIPVDGTAFAEKVNSDAGFLDKLAEMEHNGWQIERENEGWTLGTRSDYFKTHPCLIPFSDLDKGEENAEKQFQKNKDRDTIRHYIEFLNGSDYCITKI
jgi:hypothetical protein